jgi:SpoVK/Ycf46/Vps4 family AAA+-type ATPase
MEPQLFENVTEFPDPEAQERYASLIGLDVVKERLEKEAEAMLRPDLLEKWSKESHGLRLPALDLLARRPPLIIFAGDVGTGKTEIGSTFGDRLARSTNIPVELYSLSLGTRGAGVVGDMTKLITEAFRVFRTKCPKAVAHGKKPTGAAILLIDEADSLAQSRELAQMHHEDRVGVNALIRGIDDITAAKLSCLIIMCSNRLNSLDPAVRRRGAAVFEFPRPDLELRKRLLHSNLKGSSLSDSDIDNLAERLGKTEKRSYGYTFSDITQKFLPSLVLAAYPSAKITLNLAKQVIADTPPTPPFKSEEDD